MKKLAMTCAAVAVLSGCATSSSSYAPPVVPVIENSKKVAEPFDAVWDRLVKGLSSDFFVINNIDKNSRLINISFTSNKPSQFVDCGTTTRLFNNARGPQRYTYSAADSAAFLTTNNEAMVLNVNRITKLDGRTNIYIAPEGNGTNVAVNTKYALTITTVATYPTGRPAGHTSAIADFSTKTGFESNGTNGVTCKARGTVERKILDLIG